jgi:hypothetical protein
MARGYFSITIGGDSFCTTDDGTFDGGVDGGPLLEDVPLFGAATPLRLNLGNISTTRRFTITHEHASFAAALEYKQNAPADWNGIHDVIITQSVIGGFSQLIPSARVEVVVTERVGVTTTTQLTITGGAGEIPVT